MEEDFIKLVQLCEFVILFSSGRVSVLRKVLSGWVEANLSLQNHFCHSFTPGFTHA